MHTVQQKTVPAIPRAVSHRDLLALSRERDQWESLVILTGRAMYEAGWDDGWATGYEAACADMERAWSLAVRPFRNSHRPDQAELERRRWGPGGRKHFGDPRPGDYPGTGQ